MTTTPTQPDSLSVTADAPHPAERLFGSLAGAMDLIGVYLGEALGLYPVLAEADAPITASELAERAGIMPRYAREWLEQQTVAGFLSCTDPSADPDARTFSMSDDAVPVLADPDSADYFAPFARAVVLSAAAAREMPSVYRGERTFGWEDHGPAMRRAQGDSNRPGFLGSLGSSWFPAIPDVHERLSDAATPARVADVGCGEGWSSIAMALAYPHVQVDGYDIDAPSVTAARLHAEGKGVADRAHFHVEDLSDASIAGTYDLVTAFECIHDMSDPVAALRAMRQLRAPGGTVVIADELSAETFDPDAGELERVFYGFSLSVCLPDCMSREPSAATGTLIRPDTMREYAQAAGFADIEILDVPHDAWRFYRLVG
jgi:2-polyprenyl-3-methyl-5-hydroxy-6-metoxy-1,4-benzoquinol methylase